MRSYYFSRTEPQKLLSVYMYIHTYLITFIYICRRYNCVVSREGSSYLGAPFYVYYFASCSCMQFHAAYVRWLQ